MRKNRLSPSKLIQSVVEWRFEKSHRYWDDCGKLIAAIEAEFPGLVCQGLEQNGFRFDGLSKGITGAVFYWDRASISQVTQGNSGLPIAADRYWNLVSEGLSITSASRVGHRTWLCYETDRPAEAERWLERRTLWRFDSDSVLLGTPQSSGVVLRTRLDDGHRRMRLEVGAGTMTAKAQEFQGVIADVDIVVESVVDLDMADFVASNITFLESAVDSFFRG